MWPQSARHTGAVGSTSISPMFLRTAIILGNLVAIGTSLAVPAGATKRILVTGANKGIGRAICERLLTNHDDVHVLLGSRDAGRGETTVQEIKESIPSSVGRVECIEIDTSSDESVQKAADKVAAMGPLYGICNNAGVINEGYDGTLNVNYFGVRRVNDAFGSNLIRPGGRICNIASASGPMFVAGCGLPELKAKLADPSTITGGVEELDEIARGYFGMADYGGESYGVSKALLNAYTYVHAKSEPDLIINSCSPGFIKTDLTINAGLGATNPPEKGAFAPVELLMSDEFESLSTGRYYGSDAVRSPLFKYRGPGEPPYEGP